jgi:VIT1/CCC1 family predicted Fe2+/Mn2+ transporter
MATNGHFWKQFTQKHTESLSITDRNAEVIFGLIMVLTFTCSISAANAGREDVKTIIWAAIGCNTAWGIVDAIMLLLAVIMDRAESIQLLKKIQSSADLQTANDSLREHLSPLVASLISEAELSSLSQKINRLPEAPGQAFLNAHDLKNAGLVFLLVFFSTFPVVIPFFFIDDPLTAVRVSNAVALTLLFVFGYRLGKIAGYTGWLAGFVFALIGSVLVWITMMLGG